MQAKTLYWDGGIDGNLVLIDQRVLPEKFVHIECSNEQQIYDAIKTLAVRGAPAIGVAAAFGLCLSLKKISNDSQTDILSQKINEAVEYLSASRPTAVNLFWALNRMKQSALDYLQSKPSATVAELKENLLQEAFAIEKEDQLMCQAIGSNGLKFIKDGSRVLTHCNAGSLATAGVGTALAPLYLAKEKGVDFKVYADETRPLLQGARLTAWELQQAGIDVTLICDNMAGWLMKNKMIDLIIVGADRIAANGDAANKIGTYSLSILAKHHNIPFYIAAPSSTFDLEIQTGLEIPIEQRDPQEVRNFFNQQTAPVDVNVYNPAFDVTDHENITAIITEKGVIEKPDAEKVAAILNKQ